MSRARMYITRDRGAVRERKRTTLNQVAAYACSVARDNPLSYAYSCRAGISLWEWLKGRDKPEDNCMLMAIGGVASGGALTGAFVGAGIGSIFTGPGAIVGGIIGGLVGVFGGLSVGARAGAVACENV